MFASITNQALYTPQTESYTGAEPQISSSSALSSAARSSASPVAQSASQPAEHTLSDQMQTLYSSGESAQQIASTLGVPVAEVNTVLGSTTAGASQASALLAMNHRLSVYA